MLAAVFNLYTTGNTPTHNDLDDMRIVIQVAHNELACIVLTCATEKRNFHEPSDFTNSLQAQPWC